jgi:hypothetical protein
MKTDNLRAAAILTLAMLVFAMEDALIKVLTRTLPFSEVLALISIAGTIAFGVALRAGGGRLWTPALRHPAVWLGEGVGWRRGTALLAGFAGVLIVLRPGLSGFEAASLWAVVSATGFAIRDLATRRVPAGMPSAQLSASAFVALLLASVVMAVVLGEMPRLLTGPEAGLALLCGLCTIIGYTRLVLVLLIAMLVLGERLDLFTLLGAAIIVGSGLYTFWREAWLARRAAAPDGRLPSSLPNRSTPNVSGPRAAS